MPSVILSVNAGSSSLKVSVFSSPPQPRSSVAPVHAKLDPIERAVVTVEGLTAPPVRVKYTRHGDKPINSKIELKEGEVKTQEDAFKIILDTLLKDDGLQEVKTKEDIKYVCHRVVHGGNFESPKFLDATTVKHIEELSDLAPL
jgi:acetate kinase